MSTTNPLAPSLLAALLLAAAPDAVAAPGEPFILTRSEHLLHLHGRGLLIPVATEGLRKYTNEYRSPWGKVAAHGERGGRVLKRGRAVLRFPLFSRPPEQATLRLRASGRGQRQGISVRLNGRPVGSLKLDPGWSVKDLKLPGGRLRRGENELDLRLNRRGARPLLHSLEIVPGEGGPPDWPELSPTRQVALPAGPATALSGHRRVALLVELPERGQLKLRTRVAGAAAARLIVRITPGEGAAPAARTLLDTWQKPGPAVDRTLKPGVGLALLELISEGAAPADVAWIDPRLVPPAPRDLAPIPRFKNAILWVGDALRSDRLKLYNPKSPVRTPRLERALARGGAVLLRNQAASCSSPPSHASIQTGMIPRVHGVAGDKGKLRKGVSLVSALLRKAGVKAAYIGNNMFGMSRLRKPGRWDAFHQPVKEGHGADCKALVKLMLAYAKKQNAAGQRFFISALAFEPHTPYRFHKGITERYHEGKFGPPIGKMATGYLLEDIVRGRVKMNPRRWSQLRALYEGEVEYMDGCLGQLLDGLKTAKLLARTAIIFTLDHGEGFGEHGKLGHAYGLMSEQVDVPLVLLAPGMGGKSGPVKVQTVSSHLDLVPTLLDLLGLKQDRGIQGRTLLPIIRRRGSWPDRVVPVEYGRSYALRSRHYKYRVDYVGAEALFDLRVDPLEQKAITSARPLVLRYFRDLTGFYLAHRKAWRMRTWGDLNRHEAGFLSPAK